MLLIKHLIRPSYILRSVSSPSLSNPRHLTIISPIIAQKNKDSSGNFTFCYPAQIIALQKRHRKEKVRAPFTKVYDFSYTGDNDVVQSKLDLSKPRPGFEAEYKRLEEEGGHEMVKKLITLEFADKKEKDAYRMQKIMEKIKTHPLDNDTVEEAVVHQTVRIRSQIEHFLKDRKDKRAKHQILCRSNHRRNLLARLREVDRENYDAITKEFGIELIVRDPFANHKMHHKRSRRTKAAKKAYIAVKKEKIEALREKTETEYEQWQVEKMEKLPRIIAELRELGVKVDKIDNTLLRIGLQRCNPEQLTKRQIKLRRMEKMMHRFGKYKEIARVRGYDLQD